MKKPLFTLQVKEKDTGSNYTVFATVFKGKSMVVGTSFKTGTPLAEIEQWAIKRIRIMKEIDKLILSECNK